MTHYDLIFYDNWHYLFFVIIWTVNSMIIFIFLVIVYQYYNFLFRFNSFERLAVHFDIVSLCLDAVKRSRDLIKGYDNRMKCNIEIKC